MGACSSNAAPASDAAKPLARASAPASVEKVRESQPPGPAVKPRELTEEELEQRKLAEAKEREEIYKLTRCVTRADCTEPVEV